MIALLACACLATAAPSSAVMGQDLGGLERRLRDSEERERRKAVQDLAQLGTSEAWELVLDALRDPDPMVADEAQLALGRAGDESARDALLGKAGIGARAELVRLRAAEALGRIELELDVGPLLKKLKDKDPELRRTLVWTIERQAVAGRVEPGSKATKALPGALEKLRMKDKVGGVRAAALMAEHAVDPEGTVARLAEVEPVGELGCAAALLCSVEPEGLLERFRPWSESSDRAVRDVIVEALAGARTPAACELLVTMLEAETNRRLQWTLVGRLQDLSGRKHGLDPRPWMDWVAGLAPDWKPSRAPRGSGGREVGDRSVSFVGLPVLSERLVILVDFSGSLWMEQDGKSRKDAVDVELRRTLEALPETTAFNVVPYTNAPIPWKDELVPATKKNVAQALDFFEGCKAQGKGNVWDAFSFAFELDGIDTILVLTDGAPSGGTRWNLELMGELFAERNRFRRIALDAILFDAGGIERYWKRMCEASGGRMLGVDL